MVTCVLVSSGNVHYKSKCGLVFRNAQPDERPSRGIGRGAQLLANASGAVGGRQRRPQAKVFGIPDGTSQVTFSFHNLFLRNYLSIYSVEFFLRNVYSHLSLISHFVVVVLEQTIRGLSSLKKTRDFMIKALML